MSLDDLARDIAASRTVDLDTAVKTIQDTIDASIEGAPRIAEAFRNTDLTEWAANLSDPDAQPIDLSGTWHDGPRCTCSECATLDNHPMS